MSDLSSFSGRTFSTFRITTKRSGSINFHLNSSRKVKKKYPLMKDFKLVGVEQYEFENLDQTINKNFGIFGLSGHDSEARKKYRHSVLGLRQTLPKKQGNSVITFSIKFQGLANLTKIQASGKYSKEIDNNVPSETYQKNSDCTCYIVCDTRECSCYANVNSFQFFASKT